MKFNMGCGQHRTPGYINIDAAAACEPDEVFDLEMTPWPWPDSCAEEVRFIHSLEHMGGDPKVFLALMTELYRICAPDASVVIHVPDPHHDNYINDPTHVRPITPAMLTLFDRELNETWRRDGSANTPLALYTGTNFKTVSYQALLEERYSSQFKAGDLTVEALNDVIRSRNNVVSEWRIVLQAKK